MQSLDVYLTSSKGILDAIEKPESFLAMQVLIDLQNDTEILMLSYIDPCNTTIFNSFQMTPIISELNQLLLRDQFEAEREMLGHLLSMATRCHKNIDSHLKFEGD